VHCFMRSAQAGNVSGQFNLAQQFELGHGTAMDLSMAFHWYHEAAEQGLAAAQFRLAMLYENGKGTRSGAEQAALWYRKAADQGMAEAENNLGVLYANGSGVPKDATEAAGWFLRSAQRSNSVAELNIGRQYLSGTGVGLDTTLAVAWLNKAADQGEPEAQKLLQRLHARGIDVSIERDLASLGIGNKTIEPMPTAQYGVGLRNAGTQNENGPSDWFSRAAQQEFPELQGARKEPHSGSVESLAAVATTRRRSTHQQIPPSLAAAPENPFHPILKAFVGYDCTADSINTLRDQIACVDARIAASSARVEFDSLAQRILAEVNSGGISETDGRHEIYTTLLQRTASSP
jgi:Sel1 repeat